MDTEHPPLLIDIPGVQAELGDTSRTTVYELIKSGDLVKVNIGRRSFVTSKSLAAYVDSLTQAVEADGQLALFDEPVRQERKWAPLATE